MALCLSQHGIAFKEQELMFNKFVVDFLLTDVPIVIQCDGTYWHNLPNTVRRDKAQNGYLLKCGYSVLRFNDKQIVKHIDECLNLILKEIDSLKSF
jgi:very-short-patch-repair endonuclease